MGWGNGPPTWAEMERVLSGRPGRTDDPPGDGGDSPAWSRKRGEYQAGPRPEPGEPVVPYAELHAHSAYSFLDGASQPEELVEEAVRLGLEALALTDHDGLYGVVRFAEAAAEWGLPTIFGAELSLSDPVVADSEPRAGAPDPGGAPRGGGGRGGGGGWPPAGGGRGPP
ncbi:PHP domain-containing protein, partial [Nocardia wallacei]|uniref:PHP domain-containing protein n=1 Tax=Nocardia wallacei TaxID=480035 RepID=UPI002453D429